MFPISVGSITALSSALEEKYVRKLPNFPITRFAEFAADYYSPPPHVSDARGHDSSTKLSNAAGDIWCRLSCQERELPPKISRRGNVNCPVPLHGLALSMGLFADRAVSRLSAYRWSPFIR